MPTRAQQDRFLLRRSSLRDGLAGHWRLEEASGNRLDSTPNGSHMVPNNAPGNVAGVFGNALQCVSGSAQWVACADNAFLSTGDVDFTLSAWAYLDTNINASIMAKYQTTGNQREYLLFYNVNDHATNNRFSLAVSSNGTTFTAVDANSFGAASTSTWYFVVAWHDSVANTLNIQVNNGAVDSASYSSGVFDSTAPLEIGTLATGLAYNMNGRIDDARLYKRVLTSTERADLYYGRFWA